MKKFNHKNLKIFFCKMNEKNSIKICALNSYSNKITFKLNCKQIKKNLHSKNSFNLKLINDTNKKIYIDFINQYILKLN